MKRKWDERQAINYLKNNGVRSKGKILSVEGSLNGLTTCSALDYLRNYCGYTVNFS